MLFVSGLDVLVVERFSSLRIDPSDVELSVLESPVEVLDESSNVGELESTLNRESALRLHLPSRSRGSERSDLSVSSHNDDLVEIDETTKFCQLGLGVESFEIRELESEVGSRGDLDLDVDLLRLDAVHDLVVDRIVDGDGSSSRSGELESRSNIGRKRSEIGELVHSSVELQHESQQGRRDRQESTHVSPDWFDLSDVEYERMHQSENVEGHFLRREGSHTELLDTLGDEIGSAHQSSTSSPSCESDGSEPRIEKTEIRLTDNSSSDTQVLSPRFGAPSVEQSLERDLTLAVETIASEQSMIGRERKNNLSRSSDELERLLLRLDRTEKSQEVREHDSVGELGSIVESVDFSTIFGKSGEGENVVEIHAESFVGRVDVVDESFDILLRSLIERNDGKTRSFRSAFLVNRLVVLDGGTRVSRLRTKRSGTVGEGEKELRTVVMTTFAPPARSPLTISTAMDPFPTPVRRAFLCSKVTPDVAISLRMSR